MSSRVVNRLSVPSSSGWATQAAVQPTPTAASVPTIRQSPPIVGGSFSSCWTRNARSSGVIKFPSAAVRTNPSVEATIKAKRIIITILQVFYFAQTG